MGCGGDGGSVVGLYNFPRGKTLVENITLVLV